MNAFLGNILFKGKIIAKTGLHIGGSKEKLEIGGVDSPVLRDPAKNLPYIPGSSIKGKMRMLEEYANNLVNSKGEVHSCKSTEEAFECKVCLLFGISPGKEQIKIGPTRLIVRDAFPSEKTLKMWENVDSELLYTEYKGENFINRITSEANPRFIERVVPGSEFELEMVCGLYEIDGHKDDPEMINLIYDSLRLLEDSTLGGYGSRGYGKVSFELTNPVFMSRDAYAKGERFKHENQFKPVADWDVNKIIEDIKKAL